VRGRFSIPRPLGHGIALRACTRRAAPHCAKQGVGARISGLPALAARRINVADRAEELFGAWWLYPNGLVWYTRKLLLHIACEMDFSDMPFDRQRCPMQVAGWRDTSYDITLSFHEGIPAKMTEARRGVVDWMLKEASGGPLAAELTGSAWGGVGVQWIFNFEHKPGYYVAYVVTPAMIVVCFTWLSFFISRSAVPARSSLVIVCYLVLSSQAAAVVASLPRIDYPVWLHRFLINSGYFVLFAMFEFAAANMLMRAEARCDKAEAMRMSALVLLRAARAQARQAATSEEEVVLAIRKVMEQHFKDPLAPASEEEIDAKFIRDVGLLGRWMISLGNLLSRRAFTVSSVFARLQNTLHDVHPRRASSTPAADKASERQAGADLAPGHGSATGSAASKQSTRADPVAEILRHLPHQHGQAEYHGQAMMSSRPHLKLMPIRDEHLDLLCRFVFPVAYAIYVAAEFSKVPS